MYKQATKMKLRFNTEKGLLTTEQLWDCSRAMLARTITEVHGLLEAQSTQTDALGFLVDSTPNLDNVDPEVKLRFDILKDIYLTKKAEAEALTQAAQIKEHNAKIDALIARKQDQALEEKSIEELEALRKS